MATRIRIVFKRVFVKKDADWIGSGEFYFTASVAGKTVGDKQIFDAREGTWIQLPEAKWSTIVDVAAMTELAVKFNGKDEDVFSDDDLGTVGQTIRPPWSQREFRQQTEYFILEWEAQMEVEGKFKLQPPNEVAACRAVGGNAACTTVSGVPIVARVEIHPVRPVPAVATFPARGLPAGALLAVENKGGTVVGPADPVNIIPNPSVIPILTPPGGTVAAGGPPIADATNAARIEVTFYRPDTLAFTDNDPRLVWSARAINGGAVGFVGVPNGLKVMVYGTAAGEVALEVRLRGELMATFRALVMNVKKIPCRINILNGPNASSRPRTTAANAKAHLDIANRYLRQLALELTLDTDPKVTNGAVASATPGIFTIAVAKGITRKVDSDVTSIPCTILNYRKDVMNFAYIHSEKRNNILGAATDFPDSKIKAKPPEKRPVVEDSGTPSTSWILPSGVAPDAAAGKVKMKLIRAIQRPGHKHLFAMLVCDQIGDPATVAGQQSFAAVMVHELGHILNLGHRVEGQDSVNPAKLVANGIFFDGLTHPPIENVMNYLALDTAQDFDIIQARAVHESPLVP